MTDVIADCRNEVPVRLERPACSKDVGAGGQVIAGEEGGVGEIGILVEGGGGDVVAMLADEWAPTGHRRTPLWVATDWREYSRGLFVGKRDCEGWGRDPGRSLFFAR